jgi:Flp pilus assembly protein TadD
MRALAILCLASAAVAGADQDAAIHIGRAARLMQDRLFEQAGAEFELALKADPRNADVRFQYGTCLFAQGRNDEARREFEAVEKQQGSSPTLNYYLGRLDLLNNDFKSAIARLRPLESNASIPQASLYLGMAYLSSGEFGEAAKFLQRAVAKNPRDSQAHYRLARVYSLTGRKDAADKEYALYRELGEAARTTERSVRDCVKALHSGPLDEAHPVCARVVEDPNDPERLILLGQLYGETGAFADAIEPLQRAVKLDPESFEANHNLGLSLFRLKRYQEARGPLERAAALNPDYFDTLNLLAATLYTLHDDEAALPVLERAHRLKPDDAQLAGALERLRAARGKKP